MSAATLIIIVVASVIALFMLWLIFFYGRKKGKKSKEPKPQKSVEPAIKPSEKKAEPEPQEEPVKVTMPSESLKALRRQSQVKVNKKALKGDSRNPSVTKVFVDGKNVEEEAKAQAEAAAAAAAAAAVAEEQVKYKGAPIAKDVGRFGAREPEFVDHTVSEQGMPNRTPTIGDRTNFGSHLNISKDNNLSGVSGTGIAKAVEQSENAGKDIDERTAALVQSVRMNMLGDTSGFDDSSFWQDSSPEKKTPNQRLKEIDAKTLIIADAVANPKSKKNGGKN